MKTKQNWAGRILTALVTLILLASAAAKISGGPRMLESLVHAGIPRAAIVPIAMLELSLLALYLVPRTVGLATLLLTGYFGGVTVVRLISGETLAPPLVIGLIIWGGAWFRLPEFQALFSAPQNPHVLPGRV
jgi:hypothetical protein